MLLTLGHENTKEGLHWSLIDLMCVAFSIKSADKSEHTSFLSFRFVSMTIVAVFCSQIIRQKSASVSSFGP